MSQDASLKIKVEAGDVKNATSALDRLTTAGGRTEKAIGGLVAKAAGLVSIGAAINKLVQTQRQFDVLNAGLITATKSIDGASEAFAELEKFAATTPYTLDQSVQGFTKLVNLGLTPSQKALESYGNTAAAMGKDLNQMIEAVADAATGEFERLKEFGIKAKSEGDNVSFTFQGVTTTVKKNADEIEQYLMKLGETQFAGAMANRMATLDGALSNLQDSWDSLFRAVSSQGTGGLIEDAARQATEALDELQAMLVSGEMAGYAEAMGVAWSSTFRNIGDGLSLVDEYVQEVFKSWRDDGTDTSNWLSDAFWQFPQNISAAIKIAATEVSAFADKTQIYANKISAYLTPENWFSGVDIGDYFDQQLTKVDQRVSREYAKITTTYRKEIAATDTALRTATDRRLEYELEAMNRQQTNLAKFKVAGGGDSSAAAKPDKKAEAEAKKFATLQSQASQYLQQVARDAMAEQQIVSDDYAIKMAKLDEYLSKKAITQQEYDAAELASREAYVDQMAALDAKQADKSIQEAERASETKKRLDQQLLGAQMQFGSEMLGVIEQNAKEGSAIQKVAFAAQKGMAAAQAIIQAEAASMAALQAPPVGLGPVAGQAMAAQIKGVGYASAAVIAAQGFAGMFDNGGNIPSGQWGIVGEYGPEIVKGPANVTSRKDTAAMARNAMSGGNGGAPVFYQTFNITGNGDQALINAMQEAARKGAQDGYNQVRQDFATNGSIRRIAGV